MSWRDPAFMSMLGVTSLGNFFYWSHLVNTTACKRLFSLGCVPHTDGSRCVAVMDTLRSEEPNELETMGGPQPPERTRLLDGISTRDKLGESLVSEQVHTTACKRLFSLGCVLHTDGAVFQGAAKAETEAG